MAQPTSAMNIVIDLLPWEQLFIVSSLGLCLIVIAAGISLFRRRSIGPARWLCLTIFVLGAILPWLSQPHFGARLRRATATNVAVTSPDSDWPELRPRRYPQPSAEVAAAATTTFTRLGWRLVEQAPDSLTAEVPVVFGLFTDDFRIMLADENGQTVVNARSNSRVGRADFGVNRQHVMQFFTVLDQQLGAATR